MNFFTADTHFNHDKIITYCDRPFRNVMHMEDMLVSKWNAKVGPEDTVWHLGDVQFYLRKPAVNALLMRLNGKKNLIKGNHDHHDTYKANWDQVETQCKWMILGLEYNVICIHDPNMVDAFDPNFKGVVVHGHTHGDKGRREKPRQHPDRLYIDVGVDVDGMDYAPISELELLERIRNF